MSSRGGHRRRDRSWEKDDRDRDRDKYRDRDRYESSRGGRRGYRDEKRRSSRSRSPRRGDRDREREGEREKERDRRGMILLECIFFKYFLCLFFFQDRRDREYSRRNDDRRDGDHDRREDRRRDDRRETTQKDEKGISGNDDEKLSREVEMKERAGSRADVSTHPGTISHLGIDTLIQTSDTEHTKGSATSSVRLNVDSRTPDPMQEDGEAMDDINDKDPAIMAAMGLSGFGSTKVLSWETFTRFLIDPSQKGKHVEGNQEGATNVKKIRTWRQYMNRRGGFNRYGFGSSDPFSNTTHTSLSGHSTKSSNIKCPPNCLLPHRIHRVSHH